MKTNINIVSNITRNEVSFFNSYEGVELQNPRFFINRSAIKDGIYYSYVYAVGLQKYSDGSSSEVIKCFDMFNQWRHSLNDSDFFIENDWLEII